MNHITPNAPNAINVTDKTRTTLTNDHRPSGATTNGATS